MLKSFWITLCCSELVFPSHTWCGGPICKLKMTLKAFLRVSFCLRAESSSHSAHPSFDGASRPACLRDDECFASQTPNLFAMHPKIPFQGLLWITSWWANPTSKNMSLEYTILNPAFIASYIIIFLETYTMYHSKNLQNLHARWDWRNSVKEINKINTHAKLRFVWPRLKYISMKTYFKDNLANVKSLFELVVWLPETLDKNSVICSDSHFSGMIKAMTGLQDRLTVDTGISFILYLWLNLERQSLSWPCVAWTRHISLHQNLSDTTFKVDCLYTKI